MPLGYFNKQKLYTLIYVLKCDHSEGARVEYDKERSKPQTYARYPNQALV